MPFKLNFEFNKTELEFRVQSLFATNAVELYKEVVSKQKKNHRRQAHTLTMPENTCSYQTKHTAIIVLVCNIQRFMILHMKNIKNAAQVILTLWILET